MEPLKRGRLPAWRSLWLGLAAAALAVGCPEQPEHGECEERCKLIDECRFLPSPIGQDVDDCVHRCELAATSTREGVLSCKVDDEQNDPCKPSNDCGAVGACLNSLAQTGSVVGHARVQLVSAPVARLSPNEATSLSCGGAATADGQATAQDVRALCKKPGTARAFVVQNGKQSWSDSTDCSDLFAAPPVFEDLSPGVTRGGVVIQRAGGTSCAALLTRSTWLSAGPEVQRLELGVACSLDPAAGGSADDCFVPCEAPGALCHDGSDNDNDSFVDCDDPKCACPSQPSTSPATDAGGAGGENGAKH